jgi:hypothetical protein
MPNKNESECPTLAVQLKLQWQNKNWIFIVEQKKYNQ